MTHEGQQTASAVGKRRVGATPPHAQGEPMLWLTASALSICAVMILGLLLLVLVQGAGTVVIMLGFSVPIAWLLARSDLPWKSAIMTLLTAKLADHHEVVVEQRGRIAVTERRPDRTDHEISGADHQRRSLHHCGRHGRSFRPTGIDS